MTALELKRLKGRYTRRMPWSTEALERRVLLCGNIDGTAWAQSAGDVGDPDAGAAAVALPAAEVQAVAPVLDLVESEPNNTAASATPLAAIAEPVTVAAAVGATGDVDFYAFTLGQRSGVFFDLDSRDVGLSASLNGVLTLYNGAGTTNLGSNDNGYDFDTFALSDTSATSPSQDASLYRDLGPGAYVVRVSGVSGTAGAYRLKVRADPLYGSTVPLFESLPGAADTLYLDFDGHDSSTDFWATGHDVNPSLPGVQPFGAYSIPAFDFNGNATEFTPAERLAIENVWRVVAEDFSPFNINVTTRYDGPIADGVVFRLVIGNATGAEIGLRSSNVLGIAGPLDSYAAGGDGDSVAFTFATSFNNVFNFAGMTGVSGEVGAKAVEVGNTASHEFGHALGLRHFGATSPQPNGIMNQPNFGLNRERWAAGRTEPPVVQQDDVAIIGGPTNTFGLRDDDHGDTPAAATGMAASAGGAGYAANGVIGRLDDRDVFRFTAPAAGATTVRVGMAFEHVANLDAELRVYDAAGALVGSHDPANSIFASVHLRLEPGSAYYAEVRSDGQAGELGQYELTVTNTGAISGTVFDDPDGDGTRGAGEPALAGVRVYVDADNDGVRDSTETTVTTDADGRYEFLGLPPGDYSVRQVLAPVLEQTAPASDGPHSVSLTAAAPDAPGRDFASRATPPPPSAVVGRYVFYNNSAFDGGDPAASAMDDAAIEPGKAALVPGGAASFANVTSYSKGINGIMIDVQRLPALTQLSASDFLFAVADPTVPTGWTTTPAPSAITVRRGAVVNDTDRVTLIWADGAIKNTWLRVTALANAATGLAVPDVFFFGNLIGDTGDSSGPAQVTARDLVLVRRNLGNPAAEAVNRYDFNRDGRISALDYVTCRYNIYRSLMLVVAPAAASATTSGTTQLRGAVPYRPPTRQMGDTAGGLLDEQAAVLPA